MFHRKTQGHIAAFRKRRKFFSRVRKLTLTHTIGHVFYFVTYRNGNGYEITSRNYFSDINLHLRRCIEPVNRSSLCEARQKLSWEAFAYLFEQINQDRNHWPAEYRWKGHRVRAVDGSFLTLPCSKDILAVFPRREHKQNRTHYPFALMVTATNVFTGQPVAARVTDCYGSERDLLMSIVDEFEKNDLVLLDMGFEGFGVWQKMEKRGQKFINRIRARGNIPQVVKNFMASGMSSQIVTYRKQGQSLNLRLVRGKSRDRKGMPVLLVSNLVNEKKYGPKAIWRLYKRRWDVETMYYRVKQLFQVEKFHARTINGILQEVWANLFILSLTALVILLSTKQWCINVRYRAPNFKNASESIRRYLIYFIGISRGRIRIKNIVQQLIDEIALVTCTKQRGRKNPRISKQPGNGWNTQRPLSKNRPTNKWEKRRQGMAKTT